MTQKATAGAVATLVAISVLAGGCNGPAQRDPLKNLASARREVRTLSEKNQALEALVYDQQQQVRSLQALGEKRLEKLFYVKQVKLGRYTGPVDLDDDGADDAIKVYLRPIDQHGSEIKAAGEVTIQLFDLAAPAEQNLIGQYHWSVDDLPKQWSSGFVAYHYSFVCPWKKGPPKHDQITVRVAFLDYLTGKSFSVQKICKVRLISSSKPAK